MKNRTAFYLLAAYVSVSAFTISTRPAAAECGSGPDYCTDDPRIAAMLAAKKKALANEYPARLLALLDRGVQCVARIRQSPNGFSLVIVKTGQIDVLAWDTDNENATKAEMAAGTVNHYWVVNTRRAFSCDGQASYDQQTDYVVADDVNSSLALKCGNGGSC